MSRLSITRFPILIFLTAILGFTSCRTVKDIPSVVAKPISTSKLLKNVEQNAFDYKYFSIKRISCQFSNNNSKANFNINLKALKDEKILVTISKLKIPVGRLLLTPDSVKYVNFIDRNYFIDDYSYLSNFLNIDLDFATIQSIISNNAFSYRNDAKDKDFRTFESSVENGMHLLQSEKSRKIFKMEEKDKKGKVQRRMKRLNDEALILQKMYFNPENYALTQLSITDKTNYRTMNMNFSDFIEVEKKDYPGMINMSFDSADSQVKLRIRLGGFSMDKINSFSIKIPEKYEQIRVN